MVRLSHFFICHYVTGCFIFRGKHFPAGITVLMTASSQYCVKLVTYLYLFWGFNQVWSLKVSLHNILDLCTTLTFDLYMFCEVSLVSLTYSFYLVFLIPFSSTEQKTQVSFSTRTVVCLSVKFSYFPLLLQNHWTNFNQTLAQNILG